MAAWFVRRGLIISVRRPQRGRRMGATTVAYGNVMRLRA